MRHFILILLCVALAKNAMAQDTTLAKFLMIGHAYGSQDTIVPQWKSIIENADKLKNVSSELVMFLGDLTRDTLFSTSDIMSSTMRKSFHHIDCDFDYVIGNHDKYHKNYFRKSCCFRINSFNFQLLSEPKFPYLFIFLNTENDSINLSAIIKQTIDTSSSPNIVFLSHRLIWSYSNPRYKHLVELTNSPAMHQLPQVVDMDFLNQQKDKKFYFFAGDLGVNIPLFYDKVGNVTMYAVGCGGTPKDAALLAEFKRDTILTSLVHLGTANYSIEDYSLEKINAMPLPNVTISAPQGFKGYQWPVVLGIFALMALALYMVVTPNE